MGSAVSTTTLEEKIELYKLLRGEIEALETKRKALGAEILNLMPHDVKTLTVANHVVRRFSRLSVRTSLEDARFLGASKMEEVVDKEKIKALVASGRSIPGVTEYKYIQVSSVNVNE